MSDTVYILRHDDDWEEVHYVCGIYSTKEKADEALKMKLDNASDSFREELKDCLSIEQHVLDVEPW